MSPWIWIVALLGWLVLAVSGFRSYRVEGRTALLMIVVWVAIFLLVGAVFVAFEGR